MGRLLIYQSVKVLVIDVQNILDGLGLDGGVVYFEFSLGCELVGRVTILLLKRPLIGQSLTQKPIGLFGYLLIIGLEVCDELIF